MPNFTMSVHGNAFCSQQEQHRITPAALYTAGTNAADSTTASGWVSYDVHDVGIPWGWGRTFFQTGWYHVAMSNVVYFDNRPMYVDEVLIQTEQRNIRFDEIHIWHGSAFLWTGASSSQSWRHLQFRPRDANGQRMSIHAGIGISLRFTLTASSGSITFSSAMVELVDTP